MKGKYLDLGHNHFLSDIYKFFDIVSAQHYCLDTKSIIKRLKKSTVTISTLCLAADIQLLN
jgi:hypothetical protein